MARLGHARPVRPQIFRGWVEFEAEAGDTNAPAGLAAGTGTANQPTVHVRAFAGVASATGAASGTVGQVGAAAACPTAVGKPTIALRSGFLTADTASTPDHASFAVTDLDVRILMGPSFWGSPFISNHYAGQWANGGSDEGWVLSAHSNGKARLAFTTDGFTILGPESTVVLPFTGGVEGWLRATLDVNDGAGNRVTTYYTSVDGVTWDPLGTAVTEAGTVTIRNSSLALATPGPFWWGGTILYLEVRDGINGTIVANPDFRSQSPGTTSFADSTGKTWTLNNGARIAPSVAQASVSAFAGAATAAGSAGAVTALTAAARPPQTIVATDTAIKTALFRRRQPTSIVDLGAPLAQPETQAPAGVAEAAGTALQPTIQTSAEPTPTRITVVVSTHETVLARRRQPTAQFVDLGAPAPVSNVYPTVAPGDGIANPATASIGPKPAAPTAAGSAPQPTVSTSSSTNAPAGLASATGSANQPEAEIGAKPNTPIAAGAADGQTVETGSFTNAPAGLAAAAGSAFQPTIRIQPNAATGLAAGVAPQPEAEIGAKAGFGAGAGSAPQPTVRFGALAPAGLASAAGVANQPEADIKVLAGVGVAAGEAFGVFALVGNPLGDPRGLTARDDDHSLTARDGVGLITIDDDHSLGV